MIAELLKILWTGVQLTGPLLLFTKLEQIASVIYEEHDFSLTAEDELFLVEIYKQHLVVYLLI